MTAYYHIRQSGVHPMLSVLPDTEPAWSLPAQPIVLPDSLSSTLDYYLLVNEEEFKRLRKYVEAPSKLIVDYKYEAVKKKKQAKVDICDCSDDYLQTDAEESTVRVKTDSLNAPEYASTRRVRRKLTRHFLSGRNRGRYCKVGRKTFLRMPLSEALQRFTSCPTDYPSLKFTVSRTCGKRK